LIDNLFITNILNEMKNIKKLFLVAVLLLVATSTIQAVPAYPGAITHKQSDGSTLTYYLRGDENYHAQYSTDGYMLRDNGKGAFCYVTKADDGTLVTTTQIAHNVAERSADEKSFLQQVTKIEVRVAIQRGGAEGSACA
jgi:immune inhibitor A